MIDIATNLITVEERLVSLCQVTVGTSTCQGANNTTIVYISVVIAFGFLIGRTSAERNVTIYRNTLEHTISIRHTTDSTTKVRVLTISYKCVIESYIAVYSTVLNCTYLYMTCESANVWLRFAPVTRGYEGGIYMTVSEQTAVPSNERTIVLVIACIVCSQSTRRIDSQVLDDSIGTCVCEQWTSRCPIRDRKSLTIKHTVEIVCFVTYTTCFSIGFRSLGIKGNVL